MLDSFTLGIEHSGLEADVIFGFHAFAVSPEFSVQNNCGNLPVGIISPPCNVGPTAICLPFPTFVKAVSISKLVTGENYNANASARPTVQQVTCPECRSGTVIYMDCWTDFLFHRERK